MESDSHTSIWKRLAHLFGQKNEENLEHAIIEAHKDGELKFEEGRMLLSILNLGDVQVEDIMTPRSDIDFLPVETPILLAAKLIAETGHSRIPVYKESRDNIVGMIFAKDLLLHLIDPQMEQTVESIMRMSFFVPETKAASELLQEFRARKSHIAIVVDEYGGTSGLVTIEDLLEVIVGEIEDEHDAPREEDTLRISATEYELSGRVSLEDLEEEGIILNSEEVDTLGGYLSLMAGHVPQEGEVFVFDNWSFKVIEADVKQLLRVSATYLSPENQEVASENRIDNNVSV